MKHILCAQITQLAIKWWCEQINRSGTTNIQRGMSLDELFENIWKRNNLNIKLNTGYCTYELFFENPIFENSSIGIKIDNDVIQIKLEESSNNYNKKIFKTRKQFYYNSITSFMF
ncbi:hypothetical protein DMUE_1856 [Dictyocoela muelleri]|nr:hypothetical protein DMUE_1856 [Dictyocoela muelleri]